jgi:hypothetical protein
VKHPPQTLSKKEIWPLIAEGRKSFAYIAAQARARGDAFDDSPAAFDAWRHEQVMAACRKPGLRDATHADFNLILAAFQTARGDDDKALNSLLKAGTEKVRQLRTVLWRKLESAGLPPEYAQSIALDKWGVPVADLTEPQTKQLLFTITNRVNARHRKAESPAPAPVSTLHASTVNASTL